MMNRPRALLVGLGAVGSQHLCGLLDAGLDVDVLDPRLASHKDLALALDRVDRAGAQAKLITSVSSPYDIAVLAQLAPNRLDVLTSILDRVSVSRLLLEKPVVSHRDHLDELAELVADHGSRAYVNLARRNWPHYQQLRTSTTAGEDLSMTVCGGAIGIGCNGVHILDTFLNLVQVDHGYVLWSQIDDLRVTSGRGKSTVDYGGAFAVKAGTGILLCRLSAGSSAGVRMTIQGESWQASLNYSTKTWSLSTRDSRSVAPRHRYGVDYSHGVPQPMDIPSIALLTQRWVEDESTMPTLEQARPAHVLLFEILEAGGQRGPFSFT